VNSATSRNDALLDIVEHYVTVSGEAPVAGSPVLLIRFAGCDLDCAYCDTPYRNETNIRMGVADLEAYIRDTVRDYAGLRVLFTGGEPLLGERGEILFSLIRRLNTIDFFIETNGSIPLPLTLPTNAHCVVDWKTPSSGFAESFALVNLERLRPGRDCIKFVVADEDLSWTLEKIKLIKKTHPALELYISPVQGEIELSSLAEFIINNKLDVRLSLQTHKIIWGENRRGV
jgi:7-carboxy-7-deazaguanine synthase